MVGKTALVTLICTLLIAVLALGVEESGTMFGPEPPSVARSGASGGWAADGARRTWGRAPVTGASGGYTPGGRGTWGGGLPRTGASRGFGGDDDHDDFDDDFDDDFGEFDD